MPDAILRSGDPKIKQSPCPQRDSSLTDIIFQLIYLGGPPKRSVMLLVDLPTTHIRNQCSGWFLEHKDSSCLGVHSSYLNQSSGEERSHSLSVHVPPSLTLLPLTGRICVLLVVIRI